MSRVGKQIIELPVGTSAIVASGVLEVKGPKGTLKRTVHPLVHVIVEGTQIRVEVADTEEKKQRSLWGTFASHALNMVKGVTEGYQKQLEVNGVGYRVGMQGKDLKMEVGFSHPVMFPLPDGVEATTEKNVITISGIDKESVGHVAAKIRAIRKPEPYKGKGVKYIDEQIRRKAGKSAKSA